MFKEMHEPYDVVVIGAEERWEIDRLERRTTMLYKHLSLSKRVRKVLVVTSPRSLVGRLLDKKNQLNTMERTHPIQAKAPRWLLARINPKLDMLCTTALFPERDNIFSRIDRKFLANDMIRWISGLGYKNSILWIASPRIVDIAQKIPCRFRIFDAVDNLAIHPQLKRFHKKIRNAYTWAESSADLICIAAEKQKKMFSERKDLFMLPNAVDDIFFHADPPCEMNDLKHLRGSLVTYVGVMQERFNVDLMLRVVDLLKECQFVFIGPELTPAYFDLLRARPNVHFLGSKKYQEVPAYLKRADVCIIPHKVNEFTNSMDPLKIYEYLACGRPIVTTPVAGTQKFAQYLQLADDADQFAAAIRRAIEDKDRAVVQERINIGRANNWDVRVESFFERVAELEAFSGQGNI